ncbi:MAG: hypothetical protein VX738_12240 [Planctomycetota bacterium]|nr:hypothetical protein [Planctomycetota bacterium]
MRAIQSTILMLVILMATTGSLSAQGWGHIKARFVYGGEYQAPSKIQVNKDTAVCGKFGLVDESLVVNPENKGIANVIVFYRDRVPAKIHPSYNELLDKPIKVDNRKCRFEPHVVPVWTKRKLEVANGDPVGHNVKVDTFFNPPINPILPAGTSLQQTYSMEERLPSKMSCSIHAWMSGWLVIRDNPYIGVSNRDGLMEIKNLPAGEFEFQFWQEKAGYVQQVSRDGTNIEWVRGRVKIKIEDGKTTDLGEIVIGADKFK